LVRKLKLDLVYYLSHMCLPASTTRHRLVSQCRQHTRLSFDNFGRWFGLIVSSLVSSHRPAVPIVRVWCPPLLRPVPRLMSAIRDPYIHRPRNQTRRQRSRRHGPRSNEDDADRKKHPSSLFESRRRRVEDDEEGHLVYKDGDVLQSRCTTVFSILLHG